MQEFEPQATCQQNMDHVFDNNNTDSEWYKYFAQQVLHCINK